MSDVLRLILCQSWLLPMPIALLASAAWAARPEPGSPAAMPAAETAEAARSDWDPIVTGRLANGLRFAILPRRGHEPSVGLLMRNEGGFIAEQRPGERGLTHLIEHLFLVSPTHEAPDEPYHFVRIGLPLSFPAPSAGTTSWRETNYFLSTRTNQTADLDTLLALLREVSESLIFRPDLVDAQRADVLREMSERKLGNDIYADYIAAVAPESPTDVIDAQNSDDVPIARVETIRGLYHRLYRPENLMIVIVGNVGAAAMRRLIAARFGDWVRSDPAPVRAPAPMFRADLIAPISFSAREPGRRVAIMAVVSPTPPIPAMLPDQADALLMDMLVVRAINNRLTDRQPGSEAGKTGIFIENGEMGHRLLLLWDNFAGGQWQAAVAGLRDITCNLVTDGFLGSEWDRARQDLIRELERRSAGMADVPNVELAKDLSHALADDRALIPPDALLQRALRSLPMVDAQAGSDWWRRQWHAGTQHIRVEAPELALLANPLTAIRTAADVAVMDQSCKVLP